MKINYIDKYTLRDLFIGDFFYVDVCNTLCRKISAGDENSAKVMIMNENNSWEETMPISTVVIPVEVEINIKRK